MTWRRFRGALRGRETIATPYPPQTGAHGAPYQDARKSLVGGRVRRAHRSGVSQRQSILSHALRLTCLVVSLLSGCVSLAAKERIPIRTYQLDYEAPVPADTTLPVVVHVAPFRIAAAYDRDAMVYRDTRYETNAYFYHRWAAHPARMLTDLITRDLARSRRYQAVEQTPGRLAAEFVVQAQVEEIEELPNAGACTAHLRLSVVVARTYARGAPVVFQNTYGGDEACPCNAPGELAAAMSRAAATVSQQLQNELTEAISRDLASKRR